MPTGYYYGGRSSYFDFEKDFFFNPKVVVEYKELNLLSRSENGDKSSHSKKSYS